MVHQVLIIGQGYVGLPLAQAACGAGLQVTGLDLSSKLIEQLNAGRSHIDDLTDDNVSAMVASGYTATTDPSSASDADVVVICVPTPLGDGGGPDLTSIESAAQSVAAHLKEGALVVLESTTYPGTTQDVLLPILESHGRRLGVDLFVAFSPERVNPGFPEFGMKNTPKLVGGLDAESTRRTVEFYGQFVDTVVPLSGAKEAETAKLLENTYRHVNIALVNEMAKFCHDLDIDIWEVIRGAATKPFGFQRFLPGPGVGGHCIPIDPNYLSYEVRRQLGYPFRFVELAQEINNSMPTYVVDRVAEALNERSLALRGARVLLLGVTYKENISDQRESPAIPVAEGLRARGAIVSFHDPFVETWSLPSGRLDRVDSLMPAAEQADAVVLLQAHSSYDLAAFATSDAALIDTKGKSAGTGTPWIRL